MSLLTVSSRFLSTGPRIWLAGDRLMAGSSWLLRLLSLFSYHKVVGVDRSRQVVSIEVTLLWGIHRTKAISFDRIERIDYSFDSVPTDWNIFAGRTDQMERFTVSLCLVRPREEVALVSFSGEGAVETGWSGVLLGKDSIIDLSGTQDESSRTYVDLLKEFTGKTLTGLSAA